MGIWLGGKMPRELFGWEMAGCNVQGGCPDRNFLEKFVQRRISLGDSSGDNAPGIVQVENGRMVMSGGGVVQENCLGPG